MFKLNNTYTFTKSNMRQDGELVWFLRVQQKQKVGVVKGIHYSTYYDYISVMNIVHNITQLLIFSLVKKQNKNPKYPKTQTNKQTHPAPPTPKQQKQEHIICSSAKASKVSRITKVLSYLCLEYSFEEDATPSPLDANSSLSFFIFCSENLNQQGYKAQLTWRTGIQPFSDL